MYRFYLIIATYFLFSCEPQDAPQDFQYCYQNKTSKDIYLEVFFENTINRIDTIKKNESFKGKYSSFDKSVPNILGRDSVRINFNNEKYRIDNGKYFNIPRSLYNIDQYVESPKNALTYTFTQEDYDNAFPM